MLAERPQRQWRRSTDQSRRLRSHQYPSSTSFARASSEVSKASSEPLGYGQRVAQRPDKQSNSSENGFERDSLDGAERAGQAVGEFGSRVGRGIAAAAARVREEVEDIWAEAQSVRKGERA